MEHQQIGSLKSGKTRKIYHVYWDSSDRIVYIDWGARTNIGKANSVREAMNKAEAWLYDK